MDAAAVGVFGALLSYVNNGEAAAEGWLVGAVFGIFYLLLLQQDVNVITVARWWQLKYFLFSPLFGEGFQFDEHMFQMGWFNHQLGGSESFYFDQSLANPTFLAAFYIGLRPWTSTCE